MRLNLLGFELLLAARFGPTINTVIRFRKWQDSMYRLRCRAFHDNRWVLDPEYPGRRWYCCKDCGTTWLEPVRGTGVVD